MDAEPRKQYVAWLDPETDVLYAMLPQDELTQLQRVAEAALAYREAFRLNAVYGLDLPWAEMQRRSSDVIDKRLALFAALAALPKEEIRE